MKYRAELREIAIARDAVMFLSLVLTPFHLVYGFNIIGNNKLPIAEALAEHFFSLPSEETLGRRRPAQHTEFAIPLDDSERRVFNVKGETTMLVGRCCFREFAVGHVANDGNTSNHLAVFVVTRRVVTIEETVATGLRDDVRSIFGNDAFTGEGLEVVFIFTGFFEAVEDFESAFAEHVLAFHTRDALHRAVPGGVTAVAIEGDNAIDVRLKQALEK